MEQKKRHNPEITPEDLKSLGIIKKDSVVKAFDKNNDALEDKVNLEKGDAALHAEFCHLITKIFGENLYLSSPFSEPGHQSFETYNIHTAANYRWDIATQTKEAGWFRDAEFKDYFMIDLFQVPDMVEEGKTITEKSLPIYENGKFNKIKIVARTQEALTKAKEFVKAYKSLSGQEVIIIQECVDEEEMKTHLPEKEKDVKGLDEKVEKYDEVNVKYELSNFKFHLLFNGMLNCFTATLMGANSINKIKEGDEKGAVIWALASLFWAYMSRKGFRSATKKYEDSLKKVYEKEN